MPSCPLTSRTRWQVCCCLLSIMTLLDASSTAPPVTSTSKQEEKTSPEVTTRVHTPEILKTTLPTTIRPQAVDSTRLTTALGTTKEEMAALSTLSHLSSPTSPVHITAGTSSSKEAPMTHLTNSSQESVTTNPTHAAPQSQTSTLQMNFISPTTNKWEEITTPAEKEHFTVTCVNLRNQTSTSEVACFEYKEQVSCEQLTDEQKDKLKSKLCNFSGHTDCNIILHSSEVNPHCILWVPAATEVRALKETLRSQLQDNPEHGVQLKWGQVSDHQTRSQKTMIALITCGILLAILILAGYYMSNTKRWSPGRQRLGEDPYYTETDSQGNTLVSVSAQAQDKPNSGTKENGTGQAITPSATNGHSTKKPPVSDTEL
ncbi:hematopoietic progenitor cell antigen CD34 [Spea bombifrons]|uniref:hematopoietic progenitor cell antigen CD34 n=1 Tax=Spea bombifrons TaxID=233779 RepID=UPI002349D5DF|nr:hematopoietic progenitor cell antigen CD34 [Spea bombifrons]